VRNLRFGLKESAIFFCITIYEKSYFQIRTIPFSGDEYTTEGKDMTEKIREFIVHHHIMKVLIKLINLMSCKNILFLYGKTSCRTYGVMNETSCLYCLVCDCIGYNWLCVATAVADEQNGYFDDFNGRLWRNVSRKRKLLLSFP